MGYRNFGMKALNIFGILILTTSVTVAMTFPDVPETHKNYSAVEYGVSSKYVNGNPNGDFLPEQSINRAEFAKILVQVLFEDEIDTANTDCFEDVGTEWFSKSVCLLKQKEIMLGNVETNTFDPSFKITLEEVDNVLKATFGQEFVENNKWYQKLLTSLEGKEVTRGDAVEMIFRLTIGVPMSTEKVEIQETSTGSTLEPVQTGSGYIFEGDREERRRIRSDDRNE